MLTNTVLGLILMCRYIVAYPKPCSKYSSPNSRVYSWFQGSRCRVLCVASGFDLKEAYHSRLNI